MNAVQTIFQTYGAQYLALYGDRMPRSHKKTIRDIIKCRKGIFGTMVYECSSCRNLHFVQCCCGNRHCPNCQQGKADQWLDQQMKKLLPTHYFLLTITLPQGLRDVVRSHQKQSYGALFSCANEALKKLAKDKRFVGSDRIGYLAGLHTWGGMLQYHPHLHLIIPGGALSNKGQWLSSRQDLFVHTKPLEIIFKAKFKDAMEFIRRFLQHVLPKGFMKIRHYGFLNPNSTLTIEKIRELISFIHDIVVLFIKLPEPEVPVIKCSHCGHDLKFIRFVKPEPRGRPG